MITKHHSLWIPLLLLVSTCQIYAQESGYQANPLALGLKGHYGFIIPHSKSIADIADSNPWGMEAEVSWHLNSEHAWNTFGTYPRVGFGLGYFNFANPDILGSTLVTTAFFEPYIFPQKRLNASFRLTVGLAFLDQVYDVETNPENLFYSAPLSFLLGVNFFLNYRLHPRWNLRLGGTYNHISNGGIKEPNKGINFPTATLGLDYLLQSVAFPQREKSDWRADENRSFRLQLALFASAKTNLDEQRYWISGFYGGIGKRVSRLSVLTAGTEWIIDRATQSKLQRREQPDSPVKGSLLLGHELLLGRFVFSQALAIYVYRKDFETSQLYQRYGLAYKVAGPFQIGVNLKAHGNVADFLDLRLGLVW